VRLLSSLVLIVCLAGCQHGGANDTGAVRQAVIDRLAKGGYNIAGMDIQVASVKFNGEQADATISLTAKGQTGAPPMSLPYHLERQSGKWVVTGLAKGSNHGGAADPNAATNPHGGAMPPALAEPTTLTAVWRRRAARCRRRRIYRPQRRNNGMKCVAILGGGPAGAFAAAQLASAGLSVQLFDEKLAWEKPCGGGLTYKAYSQYPFLLDNPIPKREVRETVLAAPNAGEVTLKLDEPLLIYSRIDLNRLLLERAERAGAQIEKARVLSMARGASAGSSAPAAEPPLGRFLHRGHRRPQPSARRRHATARRGHHVGPRILRSGHAGAHRHSVPAAPRRLHLGLPALRPSLGGDLRQRRSGAGSLRRRLELYMTQHDISWKGATFYSHLLPSLDASSWRGNRVSGDGWMAVGDAAGLVDPITGEGLYYAIRSGDLAARTILEDACAPAGLPAAYRGLLRRDFAGDLEFGSRLAKRVFLGRFLLGSVPARMVQFTRRSPRFAAIIQDLFSGKQPYLGLKRRLLRNLNGSLYDIGMSVGFSRMVPRKDPA
jgi:flavin-dependent dehydrogenase